MRVMLCRDVMARVECGNPISRATADALDAMRHDSERLGESGGCGGVVALDARGRAGITCTTTKMAWALARHDAARAERGADEEVAFGIRAGGEYAGQTECF